MACEDCGTLQRLPAMAPGARASCPVCDALLRQTRADPFTPPLALNAAGLTMFLVGAGWSLMSVSTAGISRTASILTGPKEL